ncbi:hypothetical protein [Streptomyces sp. MK5]|uniref:hypothetical protein n=1 Tax=Streptomyces sp. MK5 TaxID=3064253 RepID=UPI002741D1FB|nr:hypothetical protein [Streptomyces sp. MK5]
MRGLSARRIASTALCAAFLVGISGPAALAADSAGGHNRVAVPRTSLPGADRLLVELNGLGDLSRLGDLGGRLTPVRDLATAVLTTDNGRLAPADAKKLGEAAEDALAEASTSIRSAPSAQAASGVQRAADPAGDALAAVQKALEDLLKSLTSGDVGQVLPAVTGLVDSLVDLVDSLLKDDGLTTPGASAAVSTLPAGASDGTAS